MSTYEKDTQPKKLLDYKCLNLKLENNYSLHNPQIVSEA